MKRLIQPHDVPEFLKSPKTLRAMLKVQCGLLGLFAAGGCVMLVILVAFLFFADPSAHSPDEIGPAAPFQHKLWPVAFVLVCIGVAMNGLGVVLRQLKQLNKNEEAPKPPE